MFIRRGALSCSRKLLIALSVTLSGISLQAATIGQWNGNPANQIWASNSTGFSSIYSAVSAAGHTVENTTEAITPGNLANDNFFIIANPSTAPTAAELANLASWVQAGHILLLFADPSAGGSTSVMNQILNGVYQPAQSNKIQLNGGVVTAGGGQFSLGKLTGTDAAVAGINLNELALFNAFTMTGGTALATQNAGAFNLGGTFRVDTINLGKVYVFGSSFEYNSNLSYSNGPGGPVASNLNLFLSLLAQNAGGSGGGGSGFDSVPEPATFAITGLALVAVLAAHRRRKTS